MIVLVTVAVSNNLLLVFLSRHRINVLHRVTHKRAKKSIQRSGQQYAVGDQTKTAPSNSPKILHCLVSAQAPGKQRSSRRT